MSCDYRELAQVAVRHLHPYVPGKPIEELARELGLDPGSIIKLASNENPLGPSAAVCEAVVAALPELTLYPDGNGYRLKRALAEHHDVSPEGITLGNGSNDVLDLVARAYLGPGTSAVFSQYAFAVYPIATQAVGARGISVPARDYGHDLDALLAAIAADTRVVFLANPNNPTGTWFGDAAFNAFMQRVPKDVLVVLDEAYIEYTHADEGLPDGVRHLHQHANLIVTRTFSKAYGLAALRVGYALSSPAVADMLNRVRQPFNVNSLALTAACAALADTGYVQRTRELNQTQRAIWSQGLEALGLQVLPSRGNFVTFRLPAGRDAGVVYQGLLQRGVILRPLANYGLTDFLRASIGLPHENQHALAALREVLSD